MLSGAGAAVVAFIIFYVTNINGPTTPAPPDLVLALVGLLSAAAAVCFFLVGIIRLIRWAWME